MRCPRCHRTAPEASWYCGHCGAELSGVNVAGSLDPQRLGPFARWMLLATLTMLVAVVVVAAGALLGARRQRQPPPAPAASGPVSARPDGPPSLPTQGPIPRQNGRIVTAPPPGAPTAMPRLRPDGPVWRTPRLAAAPEIDGRLDEWKGAAMDIAAVVFGRTFWHGPDDLAAAAHFGWTDVALFLAVAVTDDVFSQPSHGSQLHLGDSLELQIDADLVGDWEANVYDDDDWQIGISPGDFGSRAPEAHAWRPAIGRLTDVPVASQRTASGYTVEMSLPWALLGIDPTRTAAIGLALNVSDNDDPRPAQLSMVSSAPQRSWSDPRTFGTLVLVPASPSD